MQHLGLDCMHCYKGCPTTATALHPRLACALARAAAPRHAQRCTAHTLCHGAAPGGGHGGPDAHVSKARLPQHGCLGLHAWAAGPLGHLLCMGLQKLMHLGGWGYNQAFGSTSTGTQ
jgi:hypothetical protein